MKSLLDLNVRELTKEEMQILLFFSMAVEMPLKLKEDDPGYRIIRSRLPQSVSTYVDDQVVALCSYLSQGVPGKMVMWAHTLFEISKKDTRISIDTWTKYFPDGIPTEDSYRECWESQKSFDGKNRLDFKDAWE